MVCGFFVNGFYVLIITVVSVDLGIYEVLKGNVKVLFIVIVIIDGIGSIGQSLENKFSLIVVFERCISIM